MYGLYQIIYFTIIDILRTLVSPFFLLITIIIYFQYSSISKKALKATAISIIYGILGGLIATVSFIYLEVYLIPKDFFYILILSVCLSFVDKRFICISYAGSLLVLINLIVGYPKINSYEVLIVIAILHIIESILILLNGKKQGEVNYFKEKNRIVGGLVFNRFWPIPFVVFIGDVMIRPVTLVAILSYNDFTISRYPGMKTLETSIILFFYSSILLILTVTFKNTLVSSMYAILGHEAIMYLNKLRERLKNPLYSQPYQGIRVLGVEPRSIAKRLGIQEGDVLMTINKLRINNENDLIDLMKMEHSSLTIKYFSLRKGLKMKKYKGKEKTLGIITFPKVEY